MRIVAVVRGSLAAMGWLAFAAGGYGCSDPCQPGPPLGAAPTSHASTLADAHASLAAALFVDQMNGVDLKLTSSATTSCPVLTATATLNGQPMKSYSTEDTPQLNSGSCDSDTQCCRTASYSCGALTFSLETVPSAPLDFIVSDASGSREIVVTLSGDFPSFSLQGPNVLEAGQTRLLAVSPLGTTVQNAYVSSSNGVIFSGDDLTQTSTGVSFVVPTLDEMVDASAPIADCVAPPDAAMTVPCSAGLTVQVVSTAFPTTTVTKCDFKSCHAEVNDVLGFAPVVISSANADPTDAGSALSDAGDAARDGG